MSTSDGRFAADDELKALSRRVGHDLRNKLSVMRNSTYYLQMKVGDQDERLDKHLRILEREVRASNLTIINFMDLVYPRPPTTNAVDVNALIEHVLDQMPPPNGVTLTRQLAPEPLLVEADADQLGHVVENVLSYEYATLAKGDAIRAIVRRSKGKIYLEFVDSGPGLAPDELPALFDVTHREGSVELALGLLVSRNLVKANDGELEVESREGLGTRFSIVLPG